MAKIMHSGNVEKLLAHWQADAQVCLAAPASKMELDAFERMNAVQLPALMRDYFARADGFVSPGVQDSEGFSFWPLRRIARVSDYRGGRFGHYGDIYLFADYLDWSWAYGVKLAGSASPVFIIGTADGEPQRVSDSIDEFVDLYLSDDARVYVR
jgi:hypothetical protein